MAIGFPRRRLCRVLGRAGAVVLAALTAGATAAAATDFADAVIPSRAPPSAVGRHAGGCLAGAVALPAHGPGWQVMRPSRNRAFGHPRLIAFLEAYAAAMRQAGWPGLLIGDLAQPRGGPMASGHASHQTGLDADVWLLAAPAPQLSADSRESLPAANMVRADGLAVDPRHWTADHVRLVRTAAEFDEVERVFVNAAIKRALCDQAGDQAGGDRRWLAKVRPWWGHDHHLHVRLRCPPDETACIDQEPPPVGDGCDDSLDWWFSEEARQELERLRSRPTRRPTLADLPAACRSVLLGP